jgi:hypothetical protein
MTQVIRGHFDGKFIVPDEPIQFPVGQPLVIGLSRVDEKPGRFADLAGLAADLPDSPTDLSTQHDHYLYGTPKR